MEKAGVSLTVCTPARQTAWNFKLPLDPTVPKIRHEGSNWFQEVPKIRHDDVIHPNAQAEAWTTICDTVSDNKEQDNKRRTNAMGISDTWRRYSYIVTTNRATATLTAKVAKVDKTQMYIIHQI
jgi:hypothetical protein